MSDALTALAGLQDYLNQQGLSTFLLSPDASSGIAEPQLLVTRDEGTYVLRLFFDTDWMSGTLLQFLVALPVSPRPERFADLARLAAVSNRLIPSGCFAVFPDQAEENFVLRHGLLAVTHSPAIVAEICREMLYLAKVFHPWVEACATGSRELDTIVDELSRRFGAAA
ncbi:MAG TPA: hypothetical protein V6D23_22765 [Candidatus Obscuribacterales bacterium]